MTGTHAYRPKEVESKQPYEVAPADIYALAITILVIMIQDVPFGKMNRDTLNHTYSMNGAQGRFFRKLYASFGTADERHPAEV